MMSVKVPPTSTPTRNPDAAIVAPPFTAFISPSFHAARFELCAIYRKLVQRVVKFAMSPERDPASLEIIRNALESVADSMAITLYRTARSAVVRLGWDFST